MKYHFTNAICGIEDYKPCDSFDLDMPDLNTDLEESVESECDTGHTGEEDSQWTNFTEIFSFVLICVS